MKSILKKMGWISPHREVAIWSEIWFDLIVISIVIVVAVTGVYFG